MISADLPPLGVFLLAATYAPSLAVLFARIRSSVPENIPAQSYRSAIMAKVFFAVTLSIMAASPATGVASIIAPIISIVSALGGGYFLYSMIFDIIFMAAFYRMEFYGALKPVVFNLPYIPFVTLVAVLYALVEQERTVKRVEKDVLADSEGVLLGYAVEVVRTIQKPVTGRDETRVQKHYDIRPLPRRVAVKYLPTVGENDRVFNPHILIAGSSGTGKTTTAYSLITQLCEKNYPVLLVDVKGDFTEALYDEGWIGLKAYLFDIQKIGIDPFQPIHEKETDTDLIEDMMDSISVLEEVGSKQAHFLRTVYRELTLSGDRPTYEAFTQKLEKMMNELVSGKLSYGPQTRDAIMGIIDKCLDLSMVFRSDGVNLRHAVNLLTVEKPPIVVLNISNIPEKIRAIVMEFILRKVSKLMVSRGPLAYLKNKTVILAVDEAYLVAKPIMTRGGRGDTSRSKLEDIARAGRSYGLALMLVTQRLDDIADGIRQNFYRWVVFSTSSPKDTLILSAVAPEPIQKIVNELKIGHAYIRMPNPRRLEMYRFTADTTALTDGYVFQMERRLLKVEQEDKDEEQKDGDVYSLPACRTCGVTLVEKSNYCPVCGSDPTVRKDTQPRKKTVEKTVTQTVQVTADGSASTTTPTDAGVSQPEDLTGLRDEIAAKLRATGKTSLADALMSIPLDVLSQFAKINIDTLDRASGESFKAQGLLRVHQGKVKPTVLGKIILEHVKGGRSG
ncbi:MAG: helicase HerA-like domain-containing protein [Candidatus Caldarchaeum sp.]